MENILENKSKFFALYYGQKVVKEPEFSESVEVDFIDFLRPEKETFLELLPLSSITDEHLIEMVKRGYNITEGKIRRNNDNSIDVSLHSDFLIFLRLHLEDFQVEEMNWAGTTFSVHNITSIIDFLRSKNYALPYGNLPVAELVDRGWIKLKREKK